MVLSLRDHLGNVGMNNDLENLTMFIGIGASKAGTTWLYNYLDLHPEAYVSPIKEMHYFDSKYISDYPIDWNSRLAERLKRKSRRTRLIRVYAKAFFGRSDSLDHLTALSDRVNMGNDDAKYLAFFNSRVGRTHKVFGEITPSYARISEEGFRKIRQIHQEIKLVYIMRDPIQKFWSALRMKERRINGYTASNEFYSELNGHTEAVKMTLYQNTYNNLVKVFDKDDLFFGFYETMFSDEFIRSLCEFLNIEFLPGNYQRIVNAGNVSRELSPEMIESAKERFQSVYQFARNVFPDRVPSEWQY